MDVEQRQFDQPAYAVASVAPGASTVSEITLRVRNANGAPRGPVMLYLFLSDSPAGVGLTAVTASGAVAVKAGGFGADILVLTAKKALLIQTLADGTYVLSITDAAKTAFKVCVQIDDIAQVVATLAAASYGP
jgi:hypothetical protein